LASGIGFISYALAETNDGWAEDNRPGPVYQRRAFESMPWREGGHQRRRHVHHYQFFAPQVQAGWFQRPYPYHLDYYRMKFGGSYAPYFGNLYGPPQVVTAPPYYGPYGDAYGYPAPDGYGGTGMPAGQPRYPGEVVSGTPAAEVLPDQSSPTRSDDNRFPPPAPNQ
jgi:hypothetical protein